MTRLAAQPDYHLTPSVGSGGSQVGAAIAIVFGIFLGIFSWFLLGRTNLNTVMIVLGVVVLGSVVSYISWHKMAVLVTIWLFTMSGFRAYAMIYMPFMPDVSVERIIAVWLAVLFALRLLMKRDSIRGPFTLDVLFLLHTAYVLANVMYIGNSIRLHEWAISSLTPFVAYLIGKNMMRQDRDVRFLLIFFLVVSIYYYTQSIAQKFDLDFMVWPRSILDRSKGFWPVGRSRGPFLHPPLFGQMMAMVMMVQFYFFYRIKWRSGRTLMLISILMSGLGLFYTLTRAPWLAAGAGILVMAILRPGYRQLILALGVVIALVTFLGTVQFADQKLVKARLENRLTFENRLAAMSGAVRMWQDHPLVGVGYFNWDKYYGRYHRGEEFPIYGYVTRRAGRFVTPHDIYWARLAEEGVVSMALLWAATGVIWFRFRRLWRIVPQRSWLNRDGLAVFAGVFTAYLVGGAGIDYRYFDLVNAIPYLMAGILYGYRVPEHDPPVPPYRLWTPPAYASISDQSDPTASQV
jgi:O-antigen ligase